MPDFDNFTTAQGRQLQLSRDAPADIEIEVANAVRRWRWERIHRRLPALTRQPGDASNGPQSPGPFIEPILYLLTAKARNAGWTAKHHGALRAAIVGRHSTQAQKHRVFGSDQVPSRNAASA